MICYACQLGVLRQEYFNSVYCDQCKTRWWNQLLSKVTTKDKDDFALTCKACKKAQLKQDYPNTIYCVSCGSKWTNNALSQFGKNLKGYYASKYRTARKNW